MTTENNGDRVKRALVKLHVSIVLAGFTGLFGRLVTLNEIDLAWYRLLFTGLIVLVFVGLPRVGWRKFFQILLCGAMLGIHWMLFYGSIKASNISIGVICFAMVGFFTAFVEPLMFRTRVVWSEVLYSLITVAGLLCIFSFDSRYRTGIIIGMLSSAMCAVYATYNKKINDDVPSRTMLLYQMMGGLLGISLSIPVYLYFFPTDQAVMVLPQGSDLWWLLCLSLFCTVGLYLLQIMALRDLSAFTVNLTNNLEPCYTIAIAFVFFGEAREVNASFYVGITMVLASVLLQTWATMRASRRKQKTVAEKE